MLRLHSTSKSYCICNQESVYCCRERRPGTDPSCLWWLLSQLSNVQQHCLPEAMSDVAQGEMKIQMIVTMKIHTYRISSYNNHFGYIAVLSCQWWWSGGWWITHTRARPCKPIVHPISQHTFPIRGPNDREQHHPHEGIRNIQRLGYTFHGTWSLWWWRDVEETFHDKCFAHTGILPKDLFNNPHWVV